MMISPQLGIGWLAWAELGNDLRAMKQMMYDMGHLTVAKWLLKRAFKF